MLTMISNDINISEFYERFLKNKDETKQKRSKYAKSKAETTPIRSSMIGSKSVDVNIANKSLDTTNPYMKSVE